MRRLMVACLLCAGLAACGGGGSRSSDRQEIENVFNGTFAAMARGDYATACSYLSQRQQAKVVAGGRKARLNVSSCAGTLAAVVKEAGITRAQLARTFGASGAQRKLESISTHGDQAKVTFTETTNGKRIVETDALVREGGKWRADRILKRTPSG